MVPIARLLNVVVFLESLFILEYQAGNYAPKNAATIHKVLKDDLAQ
ncbi:hypothetical protein [Amphritea pacifica]|nr:hypothetical protein [Amphritea pacifica]MBN1006324.1 hypothetical protein [Amphritea pacifica]